MIVLWRLRNLPSFHWPTAALENSMILSSLVNSVLVNISELTSRACVDLHVSVESEMIAEYTSSGNVNFSFYLVSCITRYIDVGQHLVTFPLRTDTDFDHF